MRKTTRTGQGKRVFNHKTLEELRILLGRHEVLKLLESLNNIFKVNLFTVELEEIKETEAMDAQVLLFGGGSKPV